MAEPRAIVPEKGIRPGLNSTGSAIAKHVFVALGADGDPPTVVLPTAGLQAYGVVVASQVRVDVAVDVGIPDGQIGDIQVEGRVPCLVGAGGVAVGNLLQVTATGAVIVAAAADFVVGKALTDAADTEFVEVELAGPGVAAQLN